MIYFQLLDFYTLRASNFKCGTLKENDNLNVATTDSKKKKTSFNVFGKVTDFPHCSQSVTEICTSLPPYLH